MKPKTKQQILAQLRTLTRSEPQCSFAFLRTALDDMRRNKCFDFNAASKAAGYVDTKCFSDDEISRLHYEANGALDHEINRRVLYALTVDNRISPLMQLSRYWPNIKQQIIHALSIELLRL